MITGSAEGTMGEGGRKAHNSPVGPKEMTRLKLQDRDDGVG